DCDTLALLGAKEGHLYLAMHLIQEWHRVNVYDYQTDSQQLTLLFSFYQPDHIAPNMMPGFNHFGYLNVNFSEFGFDSANQQLYFTDGQNILSTPMKIQLTSEPAKESRLIPIINRVYRLGFNRYIAVLGYENTTNQRIRIPRGPNNLITGANYTVHPPTTFYPGKHDSSFYVIFDSRDKVVWTLDGTTITITKELAGQH
ncbi:MAG TPA: hypothetical protein VEC37_11555, partial [Bacillota bacterium]|nr:hypothetical protein [Bacillota bacterium]